MNDGRAVALHADAYPLGRRTAPDPQAMCGPSSVSWRLREHGGVVMTMAKARAALLQIAHPKIAAGLDDHSSFETDPFARVRVTGQTIGAILFGSPDERREALRLLGQLHAKVSGTTPDGDSYSASDPALMWFVLATLIDSDLLVEERYLGILDNRDRDAYFAESLNLADAFRIPSEIVAVDRQSLSAYITQASASLEVRRPARRMSDHILDPTFLRAPKGIRWAYRQLMSDLLPDNLRAPFGLPEPQPLSGRVVVNGARLAIPRIPARFRRVQLQASNKLTSSTGASDVVYRSAPTR